MFNQDITVYNRYEDDDFEKYNKTYLKGHWESSQGVKLGGVQVTLDNKITVVLPYDLTDYVPSDEYKGTGWTLRKGDYILKGKGNDISDYDDLKHELEVMTIDEIAIVDYALIKELNNFTIKGK